MIVPFALEAQQTAQKHVREIDYLLYLPEAYEMDSAGSWPLLVFLHGSGNTGNNINQVKSNGIPRVIEKGKKFPFIVISPQSQEEGWNIRDLKNLLMTEIPKYRVDTDRIYLTGLSMGGTGVWDLATAYPEFFAAILPICGNVREPALENAFQLRHTAVWCFHGADDKVIPASVSETMVDAVREFNPDARLTVYPHVGHDSWTVTYNTDSVYRWMLAQKRYVNRETGIDETLLEEYASYRYSIPGQSEVAHFTVENGALRLWVGGQKGELIKPASNNTFFLDAYSRKYITFERDATGALSGCILYEYNNRIFCKKIE